MSADFNFGYVPPFYREVYSIMCPTEESQIDRDMFFEFFSKTNLTAETLSQIWELSDTRQGYLTRIGFYKALALTAFAQQGKSVSEKLILNFSGDELPKPSFGDMSEVRALSIRLSRNKNPSRLNLSYSSICALDTIQVTLVPGKKGLILKHVEYEISSERFKSIVQRRYNDFVALYDLLLQRYPFRLLPQLPPKRMVSDSRFIEERRKSLKRFLTLLCRHPIISEDKILHFFLTFAGSDVQNKLKDHFHNALDEFMTNEVSKNAKSLIPADTSIQFPIAKDQIRQIHNTVTKLRDTMQRVLERLQSNVGDMLQFGRELSSSTDSEWGTGGNETWSLVKKGFKILHPHFISISEGLALQAQQEEEAVLEEFNLFLDLLTAYMELCDRHESVVLRGHQRALNKIKRKSASGQMATNDIENEAQQLENHRNFSLYCIYMETQLVHVYTEILVQILSSLVSQEANGHLKMSELWLQMQPIVQSLVPSVGTASNPSTPTNNNNNNNNLTTLLTTTTTTSNGRTTPLTPTAPLLSNPLSPR